MTADRPRVLLVDDEATFRAQLRQVITDYGVEVVGEAGSGHQAVELAHRLRPDVVLMDLRMPGMDGVMATRLLVQALPSTRVIVLSAYDVPALRNAAARAGAFAYLAKGCRASEIVEVITRAAANQVGQEPASPAAPTMQPGPGMPDA
ncbi:MAG TPA: response regulator transcription factor [Actinomycetes bacterium]